ncbi:MAG: hypothetical protein JEZ11_05710 [Desulfobacterales bacterium]|nr:hypothetical protein [Desulfobacterales bacterium]
MPKLPVRSLIKMIGCLIVCTGIGLLMIVPEYRGMGERERLAAKIRTDIETQRVLAPLFQDMLKKAKLKDTGRLILVEKKHWPRERAADLLVHFEEMGRKQDLEVEVLLPDAAVLLKESALLNIDIVARGQFSNFSPFFLALYTTPFVDHVERIQILAGDGLEEMRLKLWIAQK